MSHPHPLDDASRIATALADNFNEELVDIDGSEILYCSPARARIEKQWEAGIPSSDPVGPSCTWIEPSK